MCGGEPYANNMLPDITQPKRYRAKTNKVCHGRHSLESADYRERI
jgi:hypothetical protein